MNKLARYLVASFAILALQAQATPIFYELSHQAGNSYEYRYTVGNETSDPIDWFTIYFDLGLYDNLTITANPTSDWDGLATQPDPILGDGFADWLSFGAPIAVNHSLSGFGVAFDWLGTGSPGDQFFEINDSASLSPPFSPVVVTSSGFTRPLEPRLPQPVPAPATFLLLLIGLGLLMTHRCRRWRRETGGAASAVLAAAAVLVGTIAPLAVPSTAHAGTDDLEVVGSELVSSQRVGRTHFDYTFTLSVNNAAGALAEVEATLISQSPYTEIIDGSVALGDLGAGVTQSTDTYTFRHNRRAPFDPSALVWSFSAAPPPAQNPPRIDSSPPTTGNVGATYAYDLVASDPNPGDTLTYSLRTAPAGMTIDSDTGEIRWTPSSSGAADVDVEVQDTSGLSDRQIFLIRVGLGPNDAPPSLQAVNDQSVVAGERLAIQASATDPEGEPVRYGLSAAPAGMIVNPGTGEITWTPDTGPFGVFNATVSASDPGGQADEVSFAVQVLPPVVANRPPELAPVSDVTAEVGIPVSVSLSASDPDANDILSYSLSGLPGGASFDRAAGILQWLPDDADLGGTALTATVTDSAGQSDSQSFSVIVKEPQAPPVARDDSYTLRGDRTQTVSAPGVLTNDEDPNGDQLTAVKTSDPDLGSLDAFQGDGAFVYTPTETTTSIELNEECRSTDGVGTYSLAAGDVDADGSVELVGTRGNRLGTRLIIINGSDCSIEASILLDPTLGQFSEGGVRTLVNLDEDPELEIVVPYFRFNASLTGDNSGRLIALNLDGSPVWSTVGHVSEDHSFESAVDGGQRGKGPTAVDLNGDGNPELLHGWTNVFGGSGILRGAVVAYDGRTGSILWEHVGARQQTAGATNQNPIAVDLDLDGDLEVLWHTNVLDHEGNLLFLLPVDLPIGGVSSHHLNTAVANFDDDAFPEILGQDRENHYLFEHTGALKWKIPRKNFANNPAKGLTIAQLDDDSMPEYALLQSTSRGDAVAAFDHDGAPLWNHADRDWVVGPFLTPHISTATAFDFDRDGIDELAVVHPGGRDLARGLYVFDGRNGDILAHADVIPQVNGSSSLTIADVDGDGAAEIPIASNLSIGLSDPIQIWGGTSSAPFPPARPIRNQDVYHPTWVNDDGSLPAYPKPHWLIPGLNKFFATPVVPGEAPETVTAFTYRAQDASSTSEEATVRLTLSVVNAPSILTEPPTGASPGFEYRTALLATDADFAETFTWSLVDAPASMTIDSFGVISWTPTTAELGVERVQVVVTDSEGNTDTRVYELEVEPPVIVPELTGLEAVAAADALLAAGLEAGNILERFSLTVPAGDVLSQATPGGAEVAAGTRVDFAVSLGPQPIFVPDLSGLSLTTATATLQDAGLTLGTTQFVNSDTAPSGIVLAQSLAAQSEAEPGSAVGLTVSGGPALKVQLQQSFFGNGESVGFELRAFTSDGMPQPLPADLSITVEAGPDAVGTLPTVAANSVLAAADTRGGYSLRVVSPLLGVDVKEPFAVAGVFASDEGAQAAYATFSAQLLGTIEQYDALAAALDAGDILGVQASAAELQTIRDALDLDDLALAPAAALSTGFFPSTAPGFPNSSDSTFGGQIGPTLGVLKSSRLFLEGLDPASGRNDDTRARFLNRELDAQLSLFTTLTLTQRGTVLFRDELHELMSLEAPRLVAANLDAVLAALDDSGLIAAAPQSPDAFYAALASDEPNPMAVRPAFFTLGGLINASSIRMRVVKKFYFPIVQQVLKNTQNLVAENLIQAFFDPFSIPGIVTGASQSFHTFGQGNSIIEAFSSARHGGGNRVQVIGPTLVADLADAVSAIRNARFNNMKNSLKAFKAIRSAAKKSTTVFEDGFKEVTASATLNGCVFDGASECRQLVFGDGLPTVHKSGTFPGPVLLIVYDATSGTITIGNFLFFPKAS